MTDRELLVLMGGFSGVAIELVAAIPFGFDHKVVVMGRVSGFVETAAVGAGIGD